MAAVVAIVPTNAGATSAGSAVAASDTIDQSIMGTLGGYLEILNGSGSTDNMTISDHGQTAAGNALGSNQISPAPTVGATSNKTFFIRRSQVNPATGLVTVTHSQTTTVTYKFFPVG